MKIIKRGNKHKLNQSILFQCSTCDCIFEANNTEYNKSYQNNEIYFYCDCPFCKNLCTKKSLHKLKNPYKRFSWYKDEQGDLRKWENTDWLLYQLRHGGEI